MNLQKSLTLITTKMKIDLNPDVASSSTIFPTKPKQPSLYPDLFDFQTLEYKGQSYIFHFEAWRNVIFRQDLFDALKVSPGALRVLPLAEKSGIVQIGTRNDGVKIHGVFLDFHKAKEICKKYSKGDDTIGGAIIKLIDDWKKKKDDKIKSLQKEYVCLSGIRA